jgi:hypothetical protein
VAKTEREQKKSSLSQKAYGFPIYGKVKNVPNHQPDSVDDISQEITIKCLWIINI